jgi:hypothetical protein
MKDSKKEHRISNLKDMIDNVKDDSSEFEHMEEDDELIDFLNEPRADFEELEIDDEFIYHPDDERGDAIALEDTPINEDFLIKTPKSDDNDEYDDFEGDLVGDISENFDSFIHAKIGGRPLLAILSAILGVIFIGISLFIFKSRTDRVIDHVMAGETTFISVIFLVLGAFLLIYGAYRLFNIKNPFESITSSINNIDNDKKDENDDNNTTTEKPSQKPMPKSEIPLDKDSYKIGEFDMNELKTSLKKPAASRPTRKENVEDLPPAKEKKALTEEEIEEREYEQAKLESESIDDIFAEVEDIEDVPIISVDSKERQD